MDIWHTAYAEPEGAQDGWLGRVVDRGGESGLVGRAGGRERMP